MSDSDGETDAADLLASRTEGPASADETRQRIQAVSIDEGSVLRWSADVKQELDIAIYDLKEENYFRPQDLPLLGDLEPGPYAVHLSLAERKLILDIRNHPDGRDLDRVFLSLIPFRRIIRDYFMVCETYYSAIRNASPSQIEAIDMGRRGLHNEGADLLKERLDGKVAIDGNTARRLFTLICALHISSARA